MEQQFVTVPEFLWLIKEPLKEKFCEIQEKITKNVCAFYFALHDVPKIVSI
jgi:hypothetical protein